MKKSTSLFFVVLGALLVSTPALASSHNQSPADNLIERMLLIGLPIALTLFFVLRGQKGWAIASAVAVVAPLTWAFYRVWSMGGPFVMEHFGKHHAEAVPLMLAFAIVALVWNAKARMPHQVTAT